MSNAPSKSATVARRTRGALRLPPLLLALLAGTLSACAPKDETAPSNAAADAGAQASTDAILEELKAIRQILEKIEKKEAAPDPKRAARPTSATVPVDGKPALGSASAPVTVVEFTDYQCPYCLRFATTTFPALRKDYIDTGKVRWVALNLPLEFHPDARKAAQAALCAGDQNKFWEMRLELFKHPKELGQERLPRYAEAVGLDMEAFKQCLAGDRHLTAIDKDAADAGAVRLTGTPSFVVGPTAAGSITGRVIIGAQSVSAFARAIQGVLDGRAGTKPPADG